MVYKLPEVSIIEQMSPPENMKMGPTEAALKKIRAGYPCEKCRRFNQCDKILNQCKDFRKWANFLNGSTWRNVAKIRESAKVSCYDCNTRWEFILPAPVALYLKHRFSAPTIIPNKSFVRIKKYNEDDTVLVTYGTIDIIAKFNEVRRYFSCDDRCNRAR